MGAPPVSDFITDQIMVAVRRADPDAVSKRDLQEQTGLGTDDLRAGLTFLEQSGMIDADAAGYMLGDADDSIQERIPRAAQPPARGTTFPDVEDIVEEPGEEDVSSDPADPLLLEARYEIVVRYEAEGEDREGMLREAAEVLGEARTGILNSWPEVEVSGRLLRLSALESTTLFEA